MRWLGQMQRAFDLMCSYALEREAFGGPLADKQTVQNWIADSAAEIQACRLLTMDAARKIDEGSEARVEVSLLKFYAAGVLNDVIDRAIQVHGARGLTDETPLAQMAMHARAGRIYDGPDEVHRMVVARRILKSYAAGEPWQFSIARLARQAWGQTAEGRSCTTTPVGRSSRRERSGSGSRRVPARLDGPGVPGEAASRARARPRPRPRRASTIGNPAASSRSRDRAARASPCRRCPGQTALIWMPRRSSDGATLRTKPTTACFVAA